MTWFARYHPHVSYYGSASRGPTQPWEVVVIVVMAALIGWWTWHVWHKDKADFAARRPRLVSWAAAHGWTYAEVDKRYLDLLADSVVHTYASGTVTDVLSGRYDGHPAALLTYTAGGDRYDYGSTPERHGSTPTGKFIYAVAVLRLPWPLPDVTVRPSRGIRKIAEHLGQHDVAIGNPIFDGAFSVTGDDDRTPGEVLTPSLVEALLRDRSLSIWVRGSLLVASRPGRVDPDVGWAWLGLLAGIAQVTPTDFYSPLGNDPTARGADLGLVGGPPQDGVESPVLAVSSDQLPR